MYTNHPYIWQCIKCIQIYNFFSTKKYIYTCKIVKSSGRVKLALVQQLALLKGV